VKAKTDTNTPLQALVIALNDPYSNWSPSRFWPGKITSESSNLKQHPEAFRLIVCSETHRPGKSPYLKNYYEGKTKEPEETDAIDLLSCGEYPSPKGHERYSVALPMHGELLIYYNLEETISKTYMEKDKI